MRPASPPRWWLTRFVFLRALGALYLIAFLVLALQLRPLLGSDGLLPIRDFLARVAAAEPGLLARLRDVPSLFWLGSSDRVLLAGAWLGVALSAAAAAGVTNAGLWLALWVLYSSYVAVGQVFYGYGWETMMLEAGMLAVFLCPLRSWRPLPKDDPPPAEILWLVRWLLFRVMFGAGLIKLRGDPCWRNLTCLDYHFETQPIPNPLSRTFAHLPHWILHGGVLVNHLIELVVPWLLLLPGPWRVAGGLATAAFQGVLILSGNLAWLNYLTIAFCAACLDDAVWARVLPRALAARVPAAPAAAPRPARRRAVLAYGALVAVLSVRPVLNMLSPRQEMNASFDPLHLVNAYGAFGTVGRKRLTVVLQGTEDPDPASARWTDYEYRCQPTAPGRRPCWLAPYHLRLDWQVWFLPFSDAADEPWFEALVVKLLEADPVTLSLFAKAPFGGRRPRWVRAVLYRYRFTARGRPGWWTRRALGLYLPPVALRGARQR
jgi:Lipase maturation factor